jgi:hypothetical protein
VIYWYERREEGTYKCKTNAVSKIKYLEQKKSEREEARDAICIP